MCIYAGALVYVLTTCMLPPPSLCHRSCQAGSWKIYRWILASEQRDWQEQVSAGKVVEEHSALNPQTSLWRPQEKSENRQ